MLKYEICISLVLSIIALIAFFMIKKTTELFSISDSWTATHNGLNSKPAFSSKGLMASVSNIALQQNPKPTMPKSNFEALIGEEADDSKYTPGFYKIQRSFPALTKRKLYTYNLEG
jgi:hypothetical protein